MNFPAAQDTPTAVAIVEPVTGHPQPPRNKEFSVHGNSGCQVTIEVGGAEVFVSKAALDPGYNARLALQIEKQRLARLANPLPFVRIPKVIRTGIRDGLFHADMEYVYFNDSLSHFGAASRSEVDKVVDMVLAYVDEEVAASPLQNLPARVFAEKIQSVGDAIARTGHHHHYRSFIDKLLEEIGAAPNLSMPVGRCHGDLTFSNILIAGDSSAIAVIDFLDSFIESPLADLAKLRQDTKFKWSLLMSNTDADRIRFSQVMSYIDARISEKYASELWYSRNINIMMAMNILRIAPYAKNQAVHEFLQKSLAHLESLHD